VYRRNWTERADDDEGHDEDKQTNISPVPPPTNSSQGPSHHHQPIPGNFSLLKGTTMNPYQKQSQVIKQPILANRQNELGAGKAKNLEKVVQKNIILHWKMAKD
jgi:hypothetical protein